MASEVWANALSSFQDALEKSEKGDVQVPTERFLEVCAAVSHMFGALFMELIASQLRGDIDNSANSVRQCFLKAPAQSQTLDQLIQFELNTRGKEEVRADRSSGIVGLLWATRAVAFVVMYVELLGLDPNISAGECAQKTYEKILMPYHGWLTSKFVSTVMYLAPSREDIFLKLGLVNEPGVAVKTFCDAANPVLGEIHRLLEKHDVNFDDKL